MIRTARKRADDMSEGWKQWQGRTVNNQYPLQSFVGGSDHSAVFLTAAQDGTKAAIKLIAPAPTSFDAQIARWRELIDLDHPNVLRIFDSGKCDLDGVRLLYVVMEYADENLSQVLPERSLSREEARATLPSVLEGLAAVHAKGLVHGSVKPANILAIGDQVKLSSDSLTRAGEALGETRGGPYDPPEAGAATPSSAATDVWQLGVMLFEVLTQRMPSINRGSLEGPALPQSVPEPFREIVRNCLQSDPAKRWTLSQINSRLSGHAISTERPLAPVQSISAASTAGQVRMPTASLRPAVSDPRSASAKWPIWAAIAAAVVIAVVLIARSRPSTTRSIQPPTETQRGTATAPTTASRKPQPARPAAMAGALASVADDNAGEGNGNDSAAGVVQRSMPKIAPSAQRTVTGKLKVRVRVNVDAAGNVTNTTLTTPGPSKYFARLSEEAAREWKFKPASSGEQAGTRQWSLLFAFTRSKIEASAARVDR
jgi:TonB family C-terminal domain